MDGRKQVCYNQVGFRARKGKGTVMYRDVKTAARRPGVKEDEAIMPDAEGKVKKTVKVAAGKAEKAAPAKKKAAAKKPAERPAAKAKAVKTEIIVQSPLGGNITADEIAAKVPAGTDSVFVRVDQNKLWWIRGEETGSVDIW